MNKIKCGQIINSEITGITDYGVFVKTNSDYTGMIHISEISDRFISDIKKIYVIGETLETKVMEIDEEKKQLKLSIKESNASNNKRKPLKEDGRGFEPLKENLEKWVNEKLNELKKEKK